MRLVRFISLCIFLIASGFIFEVSRALVGTEDLQSGAFVSQTNLPPILSRDFGNDLNDERNDQQDLLYPVDSQVLSVNLVPSLQSDLTNFIRKNGNHIAAVVVVEVATGEILAMAQGLNPELWQSNYHSAIYAGFPAASIFKTVSTAAALEVGGMTEEDEISINSGCAHIEPGAGWLVDVVRRQQYKMTLGRAFAQSCNSFYAKMAMKHVGLSSLNQYAEKFRFGREVPTDFKVPISPVNAPDPKTAGVSTVGRYAAGFGAVGMSAVHAAWIYTAIARDGMAVPLKMFRKGKGLNRKIETEPLEQMVSADTSLKLRHIMAKTTSSGTASSAFRSRQYRHLRSSIGGKTGTLTGELPFGLTTWFVGMMPIDKPEIVVAAVVVTDDRWVIKGPQLAAEAFYRYSLVKDSLKESRPNSHATKQEE